MSESTFGSSIAVLVVAVVAWLFVHAMFRQISSRAVAFAFVLVMVLAGAVGMTFVDTNVPLIQSQFRPGGDPAPVWAALLAWGTRVATLVVLFYFGRWPKSGRAHA
nr:hypothetical protein [uncultured Rhodoferax sp.]